MLKRRIPTAEELHKAAQSVIAETDTTARQAWLLHPCTKSVFLLLEASRMQSVEIMENGPPDAELRRAMAQSQLASSLTDDLQDYIVDAKESADDLD